MGKSIKTERYRLVRWATERDSIVALELYDHLNDPRENSNVVIANSAITDSLLGVLKNVKFHDPEKKFLQGWE